MSDVKQEHIVASMLSTWRAAKTSNTACIQQWLGVVMWANCLRMAYLTVAGLLGFDNHKVEEVPAPICKHDLWCTGQGGWHVDSILGYSSSGFRPPYTPHCGLVDWWIVGAEETYHGHTQPFQPQGQAPRHPALYEDKVLTVWMCAVLLNKVAVWCRWVLFCSS